MAGHTGRTILLTVVIVIAVVFAIVIMSALISGGAKNKIGVVEIEGTITDLKDVMTDIVRFKEDDSIRAVIIRINSPGGAVGPTQEAFAELKKLKDSGKKVYVSMGSVCASGGYYIAAIGEKVYANPSTITGSIGVIMQQTVVEDLMKKIGVESNTIKAGSMKDVGNPFRKMTDSERQYLQEMINSIHEQFIKDVAAGRKMTVEKVRELSDGRIYTGLQAKEAGLVDNIGTFYDAVDGLKAAAGIPGKPDLVYGKRPFSPLKWLVSSAVQDIFTRQQSEPFQYRYQP